jgi:CDP-4-dehydro-6-deoxyglucose reductase
MCRARAASDLVIETAEATGVADVPLQELIAKVVKLERLTDDLMVVHLRTPRSKTLRFLAGQYVTLEIDGLPPRDKSIASCPCSGRLLQVHFRRREGDPFPKYVFSQLRTSKKVLVTGPFGEFILNEASPRPIIFLAYETGFASIKSLIEHAIALELEQPLHLYWVVEKDGGHYMRNYCRAWVDSLDSFRYTPLHLHDSDSSLGKRTARVFELLWSDYPDLSGVDLYMSIPVGAEHPLRERLLEHGLPEERLRMELLEQY